MRGQDPGGARRAGRPSHRRCSNPPGQPSRKTRFRPRQIAGGRELTPDETRRLATATTREEWAKIAAELACDGVTHSEIGQKTGFARVNRECTHPSLGATRRTKYRLPLAASSRNRHNVVFKPTGKPRRAADGLRG